MCPKVGMGTDSVRPVITRGQLLLVSKNQRPTCGQSAVGDEIVFLDLIFKIIQSFNYAMAILNKIFLGYCYFLTLLAVRCSFRILDR